MNRWSKIVLAIGGAGLVGWIATGLQGRSLGESRESLALHTLAAFASTLTLILADAWIVVFLAACERGLRRARLVADERIAPLASARRRTTAMSLAAAGATLALLALSGLFYPGRLPPWSHLALALLALLLQTALWFTARAALSLQHAICTTAEPPG